MTPEQKRILEQYRAQRQAEQSQTLGTARGEMTPDKQQILENYRAQRRAEQQQAFGQDVTDYGARPPSGVARMSAAPEPPGMIESTAAGVWQGLKNLGQGGKSLFMDVFGLESADEYAAKVQAEKQAYNRRYNPPTYRGGELIGASEQIDVPQIIGESAPFAASLPMRAATTILGAGLRGAGAGAATGGLIMPESGETVRERMGERAGQAAFGAVGGAIPTAGAQAAAKAGTSVFDFGMRQVRKTNLAEDLVKEKAKEQFTKQVSASGAAPRELAKDLPESAANLLDAENYKVNLNRAIETQMQEVGRVDAQQAMRAANIERVTGVKPTRAQVTRDAGEWTREQNLAKEGLATNEGESITQRFVQQDKGAQDYARKLAAKIAGTDQAGVPTSNFQASKLAIDEVKKIDAEEAAEVSNLYRLFRETDLTNELPSRQLSQNVATVIDDFGEENIGGAVMRRLREFGFLGEVDDPKAFTPKEADKLSKLINNNIDPTNKPKAAALGEIKRAVDNVVLNAPDSIFQGAPKLKAARARARERFSDLESSKALIRIFKDTPPDRFMEQNILGGNVQDIANLQSYLKKTDEGAKVWDKLKGRAWESIIDDVTKDGSQAIRPAQLRNRLRKLGPDRLQAIFEPEEIEAIGNFERAVVDMFSEPDFAAPNRSNTSSALMGALTQRLGYVPFVGGLAQTGRQLSDEAVKARALREGLEGTRSAIRPSLATRDQIMANVLRRFNQVAAPVGAATAVDIERERPQ